MGVLVDHDFAAGGSTVALQAYSEESISYVQEQKTGSAEMEVDHVNDWADGTTFEASDNVIYTADVTVSQADVDVECNIEQLSSGNSGAQAHLFARLTDTSNYYGLETRRHGANPDHAINKRVAGVNTELATGDVFASDGNTTFDIKFELRGSTLKCFVDTVEEISVADSALSAAGDAGIGLGDVWRSGGDITDKFRFNTFKLTEITSGVTVTPSAAAAVGSKSEPGVVLGSISITPGAASAIGATVPPSIPGQALVITPPAASALGGSVAPSVVLGSLVLTPTAAAAVAGASILVAGGLIVPRDDAGLVALAKATTLRRVYLARLGFDSGDVLVHSWDFFSLFFDWNEDNIDEQFVGVGRMGGISPIEESADLKSHTMTLMLAGVPQDRLDEIYNAKDYQNRPATLWEAWLDDQYRVSRVRVIFKGRMDAAAVRIGESATIELPIVSRLAKWEEPRTGLYTDADQKERHPGDLGLEFMQQMAVGREIPWGRG